MSKADTEHYQKGIVNISISDLTAQRLYIHSSFYIPLLNDLFSSSKVIIGLLFTTSNIKPPRPSQDKWICPINSSLMSSTVGEVGKDVGEVQYAILCSAVFRRVFQPPNGLSLGNSVMLQYFSCLLQAGVFLSNNQLTVFCDPSGSTLTSSLSLDFQQKGAQE